MKQIILGGGGTSVPHATLVRYNALQGIDYWYTTELYMGQLVSIAGTLKGFRVRLSAAPGAGKSYTFRLRVNGANSTIVVTISDTDTTGLDDTHEVNVNPGDRVNLTCTPSGTPAATTVQWSINFECATAGASLVMGNQVTGVGANDTNYVPLMTGRGDVDATESSKRELIPTAGKLKNLYVRSHEQLRATQTLQYVVRVNGGDTALACTITPLMYEYYITGEDGVFYINSATRLIAQTFTPALDHQITVIKIKCYRVLSPGTITVEIQGTDGAGHPDNTDIASGTLNGNAITTGVGGAWYEIDLGAGAPLSSGTKYAIVFKAPGADGTHKFYIRVDSTGPTYGGGTCEWSNNLGAAWTAIASDMMFEEGIGPSGQTANNTADEVAVVAGDIVTLKLVGTPAGAGRPTVTPQYGCTFVADRDDESIVMNCPSGNLSSGLTVYNRCCGGPQIGWGVTESDHYQLANAFVAGKFYVQLTGAPGAGKSYTFTIRKNGGGTPVVVVIADTDTTGNDHTHSAAISDGDVLDIEAVPANTPAAVGAFYGFVVDAGGLWGGWSGRIPDLVQGAYI